MSSENYNFFIGQKVKKIRKSAALFTWMKETSRQVIIAEKEKIGCSTRSITLGSVKLRLETLYRRAKRISLCTLTMRRAGHRNWVWTTSLTNLNLKTTSMWTLDTTPWCLPYSFERSTSCLETIHPTICWPHIDVLSVNMKYQPRRAGTLPLQWLRANHCTEVS